MGDSSHSRRRAFGHNHFAVQPLDGDDGRFRGSHDGLGIGRWAFRMNGSLVFSRVLFLKRMF